jgi:hypothetical protein
MYSHKKRTKKATGGLMDMPPYLQANDESDKAINSSDGNLEREPAGIGAYDINTPKSARKGLPSRLLGTDRTRFSKGDVAFKDPNDFPDDDDRNPDDGYPLPGDNIKLAESVKDKLINKQIKKLENQKAVIEDASTKSNIDNQIKKLKSMMTKVKAALGGYMDENDISEQTPLALNIGGAVGRQEDRKDYQAYAEGDIVDDEAVIEDDTAIVEDEAYMEDGSLLRPTGMEDDMLLEDDMSMEDDSDVDGILDTSSLSEEEEIVLDEAIEMHPELEAIIPKIVATEFTEDELVEGPGDGTSDSIPALLSDGEFVFTAKAVKSLGVDTLRDMMAQAEADYDAGQVSQEEEAVLDTEESLLA